MADADIGFQTKFLRGGTALPTVYASVGQVVDIKLPELSRDTTEVTHYESPGKFKEFLGTLFDAGEAGFTIQFSSPTAMATLLTDFTDRGSVPYRIEWPDAEMWDFVAIMTSVAATAPIADKLTAEITVKLTGKPAFLTA